MSPDEVVLKLAQIESEQSRLRVIFEDHTRIEEERFDEIATHVRELREIFIGAKGAARVLGWLVAGCAAVASFVVWFMQYFQLR